MNDEMNNLRRFPSDDGSNPGDDIHPSVERLSEYLDGDAGIGSAERKAITGHLASCQACQIVLTELQTMVQTLGVLPQREVPRSFAITPEMVEPVKTPAAPEPIVLQESAQWHARHAGKVRWATAVAAILFVFVISADLMTNVMRGGTGTDESGGEISALRQEGDAAEGTVGALSAEDPPAVTDADSADEAMPESADAPASDDAELDVPGDAALRTTDGDNEEAADDMSTLSAETDEISDEPASELAATSSDSSQMRWRVAQVSLALVLALLLAVMIGLPKQRGTRRH